MKAVTEAGKQNLVVFATYWNEIAWVEASLAQLDLIDPCEVIICDGCFDPRLPPHSTDGTREILEAYVEKRPGARLVSPMRLSRLRHVHRFLKPLRHESSRFLTVAKLRAVAGFPRWNVYRLNQMATFNRMFDLAERLRVSGWFMTYDCDQFYSDQMLASLHRLLAEPHINLLVGRELTFFGDFESFTPTYETRDYNNMPHRLFSDTRFIPTRHPARVVAGVYRICSEIDTAKKEVGPVYHYHLRPSNRRRAGYALGDRRPPPSERMETTRFTGEHPETIRRHFL
jgi:hypothetical protein